MEGFHSAYNKIKELANDFKAGESHYLSKGYQEAEVRKDFIDKFWMALGWDVHHNIQKNPFEQEVKVEKGVSVSGAQKRADYSFALAPNYRDPKFFVEAKKPAQNLLDEDYYFQTIRYGWHKNTPIAVLTDFEEFHVLDCRYTPDINTVLSRQVERFHYTDYYNEEKFAYIYWLFSREAVVNNSLEKISEHLPKPKGKAVQKALFSYENLKSIDDDFLKEIEEKRETLAKALKKNDETLNSEELTEATQKILDRLVFIRFLEDKLIEQEHYVSTFGEKGSAWHDFINLSRKFEVKYSGIVFKRSFIDEPDFKGPIGHEFYGICQGLCHLNSRFLYNEIPIHILGSIYERFLGKVVHATEHRVKIEDKPAVRKAGGVYYTPKYIVDYIVQNTIGKLVSGKAPEQISKMRFADIACGSGSFLIGVFDFLLNYHNHYYQQHPEKAKKDGCYYTKDGIWVMSLRQKQNILRNNIYGVDIDSQAVEVTQLSLSLKMLEDETTATANEMMVLFHEKILPDMTKNIVCGNSLIGTDILTNNLFAGDEERKLNPMDFNETYSEIMQSGGFNALVGNPPWVDLKGLGEIQVHYFFDNYKSVENRMNLYSVFVEKCLSILNKNGILGYVIPNSILFQSSYTKLRQLILKNHSIIEIVRLPDNTFRNVKAETIILTIGNKQTKQNTRCLLFDSTDKINAVSKENSKEIKLVDQATWLESESFIFDIYGNETISILLSEIEKKGDQLVNLCDFCLGLTPYDKYKGHTKKQIEERVFHASSPKNKTFKKLLAGGDVQRYDIEWKDGEYISYGNWLGAPREKRFFTEERILVRQIISGKPARIFASITNEELYNQQSVFNLVKKAHVQEDLKYILALLNSKLVNYYHKYKFLDLSKNLFQKILIQNSKKFPVKRIDFNNSSDRHIHDQLIHLVDQIILSKKQISIAKTEKDKNYYDNKFKALDRQIDNLVYQLYELTEEQIKIVETT